MTQQFLIEGGIPLNGTVTASGNKNAALKLLPACILTSEPVTLHNIPDILDVRNILLTLQDLGVEVIKLGTNSFRIHAAHIRTTTLNPQLAKLTRASFVFSGPMLGRMGRIELPVPGGDVIGGRPLDTHIQGLRALGAKVELDKGSFRMSAEKLHGAGLLLQYEQSVTATENTIMGAVLAEGETTIENAACEPHVRDLCHLLVQMGAKIEGIGTNRLHIQGVPSLSGTEFTIGSDFMEVGSFIGAAAVTGGHLRIKNASPRDLGMVQLVYRRLGVEWQVDANDIIVSAEQSFRIEQPLGGRIPEIKPLPWPGFPPDLMSILVILATQSHGTVLLHDWMYESRFFFIDKLVFMGARIVMCDPHRILVQGKSQLQGDNVVSPDIRAGMAMLLAALCAKGTSTIGNINQIDRGYENIEAKLRTLGANITRQETTTS